MALIRKEQKQQVGLPSYLTEGYEQAARLQIEREFLDGLFKEKKAALMDRIENDPSITMTVSEALKIPELGQIVVQERANYDFDISAMYEKVKSGEVSEEDFLSVISGVDNKGVEKVFANSLSEVRVTKDPTVSTVLRASNELKVRVLEELVAKYNHQDAVAIEAKDAAAAPKKSGKKAA